MKKVIAFIGSPNHNGNISSIVNKILEGASENGFDTKIYYLNDMNIKGAYTVENMIRAVLMMI